jgi:hypothetical protein
MLRFPLSTAFCTGLVLFSGLIAHAEGPLDLIPASASAVVRIKSPQATIAKVANFVNAVQPGMGFAVQMQAPALGIGISNPTMGGVDLRNDWYVAVFAVKNAEPAVVFLIPASKGTDNRSGIDQMKEAVGEEFTFVAKDNWVAYSMDEAVIELVEDCIDGAGDAIQLDRRSGELFAAGDASIYVNIAGIAESYSEELDAAEEQLDVILEGFMAQIPQTPGINLAPIMEMYGQMGHGALRTARDSNAFTLGLMLSDDSITIEELLLVKDGSDTDKYLQTHKTSDLSILNSLPRNKLGYFALHADFGSLAEWGMDFAAQMLTTDDNAEILEKLKKVTEDLKTVKFGSAAWAFDLADKETGILRGYAVTEATPASKMREITRAMGEGYQFNVPGVKQEFTVETDAEKYGDLSADVIRIKQEFDESADPLGIQKALQEALYGKNGTVQRVVIKGDNQVVQTFGGGPETMKEMLATLDAPATTGDTALTQSRGRLMEKANLIALIDLPNLALKIAKVAFKNEDVKAAVPFKGEFLEGAEVPTSFIGFSAGTEAQGIRLRTEIPATTFKNFVQIAAYVQQQQLKERQKNNNDDF